MTIFCDFSDGLQGFSSANSASITPFSKTTSNLWRNILCLQSAAIYWLEVKKDFCFWQQDWAKSEEITKWPSFSRSWLNREFPQPAVSGFKNNHLSFLYWFLIRNNDRISETIQMTLNPLMPTTSEEFRFKCTKWMKSWDSFIRLLKITERSFEIS